jgi:hypothetical protein
MATLSPGSTGLACAPLFATDPALPVVDHLGESRAREVTRLDLDDLPVKRQMAGCAIGR